MFNGLDEKINATLEKATQEALKTTSSDAPKIEIEFRLKSFAQSAGETTAARGSNSRDAGAFKRTLRQFREYALKHSDNWAVRNDGKPVEDQVFAMTENYRVIQKGTAQRIEQKVPMGALDSEVYPVKLSFATEREAPGMPEHVKPQNNSRRVRNRWTFDYKPTSAPGPPILRVDMTIVTAYNGSASQKEYEIEVEALGEFAPILPNSEGVLQLNQTQSAMSDVLALLIRIHTQTRYLYDTPTRESLILNINRQFDPRPENKQDKVIYSTYINQPIPMQWKDLETEREDSMFPNLGLDRDPTVADAQYAVTIKADGERIFVYWASSGVWLFNPFTNALNRISPQEVPELTGCMLDGELVEIEVDMISVPQYKVLVFDCLFARDGPSLIPKLTLKSLKERLSCARYIAKVSNAVSSGEGRLVLEVKQFVPFWDRQSFYSANVQALRMNKDRNNVEIFKSDGLVYTDTGRYLYPKRGDTNPSRNRKFKQLDQLTVDFLVDKNEHSQHVLLVTKQIIVGGEKKVGLVPFVGEPKLPANPTDFLTSFVDPRGEKIDLVPGMIAEFRWDKQRGLWVPLRLREDRVEPNKYVVAIDNWRLIHDNIPIGILINKIKGAKVLGLMSKFHNRIKIATLNYWSQEIASRLQEQGDRSRPLLLDMGSGKGGDVTKWKTAGFEVIAVEPDSVELDKLEKRAEEAGILDRVQTVNIGIENSNAILTKFVNLGIKKADMVSSFHMMTFLYKDAQTVDGFVKTVVGLIKKGGILVVMAMDGLLIHEQLGDNAQVSIEGIKIQRSKNDPRKVTVKLRVADQRLARGQVEYLVDFDDLISRLEANGFELINDNHLSSGVALNDSELWWSQMTRMIELRYVGAPDSEGDIQRKRLSELNEIMKAALKVDRQLKPDEKQEFPRAILAAIDDLNANHRIWTIGAMGDGSCFLHAILWSRSQRYRGLNKRDRMVMVMKLREELAANFMREEYLSLANGAIAEMGTHDSTYSYANLKSGLQTYTHWFGLEFLIYVSNQLDLNIHLLWMVDGMLEIYDHAPNFEETYKPERHNVILFWQGGGHFQSVGRSVGDGEIASLFSSQDSLIQQMVAEK